MMGRVDDGCAEFEPAEGLSLEGWAPKWIREVKGRRRTLIVLMDWNRYKILMRIDRNLQPIELVDESTYTRNLQVSLLENDQVCLVCVREWIKPLRVLHVQSIIGSQIEWLTLPESIPPTHQDEEHNAVDWTVVVSE